MNYLEQIVAFHRWKEVNPLPASAIALWHEMMAVCNKAGWPDEFTVPNVVLQSNAGLSRKEFDRARQLLLENGLVQYKKSHRVNNAGKYKLLSRVSKKDNGKDNGRDNARGNGADNDEGNERDNFKKSIKQNETETKTKYAEHVIMTENEYRKLIEAHGSSFTESCIVELDNYKGASGKRYKSDYHAILKWVVDRVRQKRGMGSAQAQSFADLAGGLDDE